MALQGNAIDEKPLQRVVDSSIRSRMPCSKPVFQAVLNVPALGYAFVCAGHAGQSSASPLTASRRKSTPIRDELGAFARSARHLKIHPVREPGRIVADVVDRHRNRHPAAFLQSSGLEPVVQQGDAAQVYTAHCRTRRRRKRPATRSRRARHCRSGLRCRTAAPAWK